MRDYESVVNERYNRENLIDSYNEDCAYSLLNPIGFYSQIKIDEIIRAFLKEVMKQTHKSINDIKILDVGCGKGGWTRTVLEYIGNPNNVTGMEFSRTRLEHCKEMNPAIDYFWGDITQPIKFKDNCQKSFDGIICADVLMHIRQEADLIRALENMGDVLSNDGIILWYDNIAKTHFDEFDADCQGFNEKEMDYFATQCGFKLIRNSRYYKQIRLGKHIFNTVYRVTDSNRGCLRIIESLPIGSSVVTCRLYKRI